jgi:flagellar biosynthesis/type III secretory pathway protein FliH
MQLFKKGEHAATFPPLVLPEMGRRAPESSAHGLPGITAAHAVFSTQTAESIGRQVDIMALQQDPNSLLEKARAEAAQIVAEAQAQVAETERVIREQAITEARTKAAAEVTAEVEAVRAQLAQTLDELAELREQVATYAEREMVQLAIEIAKKIVRREVTVDREIVISLARVALSRLHNRALATVHLHPDDYQFALSHRERLSPTGTIKLVEDPAIGRGGCLIETDLGDVDARIEHQFSEIERGFLHDLES